MKLHHILPWNYERKGAKGIYNYYECRKCGHRKAKKTTAHLNSPKDTKWLNHKAEKLERTPEYLKNPPKNAKSVMTPRRANQQ